MSKSIIKQKRILTKAGGGSSISTPVSVANGGTGISSYAIGDIIYASGATTLSKLAIGTASQQLRVNAGATALEYFTPASSGITIGGTAITSGADYRILFQDATASDFVTQTANFTMGSVATGYLDVPTGYAIGGFNFAKQTYNAGVTEQMAIGYLAGVNMNASYFSTGQSLYIGIKAGRYANSAFTYYNTVVGNNAFSNAGTNGADNGVNTIMGYNACSGWTSGNDYNVIIGSGIGTSAGSIIRQATYVGTLAGGGTVYINSGAFGYGATPTAANQLVFGNAAAAGGTGVYDNVYFNGVTHTSAASVNIRACGGSGSNNVAGNLNFYAGLSTGSGTPAVIGLYSSAAGASSSTAQTAVKVLEITNSTTITTTDAVNYALGSSTGTKWGTATTQKQAFWNATPIVQPSGATQAAPAAYATGVFGLDSDVNMQALYDLVVAMRTVLVNTGLMKGSA